MSYYGFAITDKGQNLIAKLMTGKQLTLSRIMVGSGLCPDDTEPRTLTDLVQPVAAATSTVPVYDGASVNMTVEYRSNLNGGLERGFWLNEFGVFAIDPDDGEILIYYGCLGDYPQWVSPASDTGVDVRRFPITIVIEGSSGVKADYSYEAWITAEDMKEYCTASLLPLLLVESEKQIKTHDADEEAHPQIRNTVSNLDARLSLLELIINTDVTGNPFTVTFGNLDGIDVEGVWNATSKRVEF